MQNKNIFVLGPNNSGSTLLMKIMKTCPLIVGHGWEGQSYARGLMPSPPKFGLASIWTEKTEFFRNPDLYNWPEIKKRWIKEWKKDPKYDASKKMFFLEKSPFHTLLVDMLLENFDNPFFIITQRNPYALIEGILRRKKQTDLVRVAKHVAKTLKIQKENIEKLGDNQVNLTYELLCDDPEYLPNILKNSKYPELSKIDLTKEFKVHSYKGKKKDKISNYNEKQLKNLSEEQIYKINDILSKYKNYVEYFGYKLLGK